MDVGHGKVWEVSSEARRNGEGVVRRWPEVSVGWNVCLCGASYTGDLGSAEVCLLQSDEPCCGSREPDGRGRAVRLSTRYPTDLSHV